VCNVQKANEKNEETVETNRNNLLTGRDFWTAFYKLYTFFGKRPCCCLTHSQDGYEVDKLATGLTYQQLNGGGVTTTNLANQIKIVFRL
jgi:hypothetical protein